MKKTSKVLSVFLALSMMLTACGGGSNNESSTASESGEVSEVASGEVSEEPGTAASEPEKMTDANTLVVGSPELNGDYINGFTNSSYDVWIRRLIGTYEGDLSYATYAANEAGEFIINPTVNAADPVRTANEDGSVTYTYKIADNLLWSDGEPITAADYVFTSLFRNGKAWGDLGAANATTGSELKGYSAYHSGESAAHAGLHLIDEHTFSLTLDAAYVPYFYETAMAAMVPTPLHRYAPNLRVVDSEEGAMLQTVEGYTVTDEDKASLVANQEKVVAEKRKAYDAERQWAIDETDADGKKVYDIAEYDALVTKLDALSEEELAAAKKAGQLADGTSLGDGEWMSLYGLELEARAAEATLKTYKENPDSMDPLQLLMTESALEVAQNFRFKPDVTCGPYKFVEFSNGMAKVTINDKFVGNKDGKKPTIQNVIVQTINTDLEVDYAMSGQIDLAIGVVEGAKIDKARENADSVGYINYPRNGYGFMPILTDIGATQYKGVRQAIAFCLDREEFVQTICGGYGTVVQGAYGLNMWEYEAKGEELEEKAINYTLNPDEANKALDTTPYLYEADGTTKWDPEKAKAAYDANKEAFDYWRYDENGKQLTVYHEGSIEAKEVSGLISVQVPDNAKLCGMQYIFKSTDFATMLTHYYNPDTADEKAPTVFNMGNSFSVPNDPYYQTHSSQIGADNKSRINDPTIDPVLEEMRKADPTDRETWLKGWLTYELWYNDYMPGVPLYGNDYHDIYNVRVKGLETTPMWDWANDICDVTLAQ